MTQPPIANVPVHLVTGFLGSGKSSLIRGLLAQKPANETWAVLINEFGQVGIDQALFDERRDVVVKGLPGGCLCCQLAFVLQATLVNLLHRHRPDRLLIEPSGLGHPAGLLDLLRGEAFQGVLEVRDIIAVLDPRRLDDSRTQASDTFHAQLAVADAVVLTMADLVSPEQRAAAQRWAESQWPPRKWVVEAVKGQLPLTRVLSGAPAQRTGGGVPEAHRQLRAAADPGGALEARASRPLRLGQPQRESSTALGHATLGWRWHPAQVFDLDRLSHCLGELPGGVRAKGVFHTSAGWRRYNRSGGAIELGASDWRQDSRLELIAPLGELPEAEGLEAALAACQMVATGS